MKATEFTTANITVKNIFDNVSNMNAESNDVSSLGSYVSQASLDAAISAQNEVESYLPADSFAAKVLATGTERGHFSDKQLWVISYELMKNEAYKEMLAAMLNRFAADREYERARKREARARRAARKAAANS